MKSNYIKPELELIELAIEDAVLDASGAGSTTTSKGTITSGDYTTLDIL